jgi:hypothetical protein
MEPELEVSRLGRLLEALVKRSRLLSRDHAGADGGAGGRRPGHPTGYDRFFWERLGGAGAVYGLFACFVIVVVSKFLGYKLLYRPEDYFDNERKGNA